MTTLNKQYSQTDWVGIHLFQYDWISDSWIDFEVKPINHFVDRVFFVCKRIVSPVSDIFSCFSFEKSSLSIQSVTSSIETIIESASNLIKPKHRNLSKCVSFVSLDVKPDNVELWLLNNYLRSENVVIINTLLSANNSTDVKLANFSDITQFDFDVKVIEKRGHYDYLPISQFSDMRGVIVKFFRKDGISLVYVRLYNGQTIEIALKYLLFLQNTIDKLLDSMRNPVPMKRLTVKGAVAGTRVFVKGNGLCNFEKYQWGEIIEYESRFKTCKVKLYRSTGVNVISVKNLFIPI